MPAMRGLCLALCCALAVACAAPPGRVITVGLAEYAFVPATVEVAPGERVRIVIRNTGRLEHDFAPDQRGLALGLSHAHVAPGGSTTFDWTAPLTPTLVRITCTIAGHEGLGMIARLVVRDPGQESPSAAP